MNAFREILPPETDAYLKDNLLRGLRSNAALGWTQTQDAGMSYRLVGLMKEIHEEGDMAHRVYAAIPVSEAQTMIYNSLNSVPGNTATPSQIQESLAAAGLGC